MNLSKQAASLQLDVVEACARKSRVTWSGCSMNCNQGRACDCVPSPAEAANEVGHSDGEPITGREALKVWLVMCAPALGSAALLALILWAFKP